MYIHDIVYVYVSFTCISATGRVQIPSEFYLGSFVCSFEYLERECKTRRYIDVWPLCVWQNETFDTTFLLLLQLACVLHMKQGKSNADLRIFIVVESE